MKILSDRIFSKRFVFTRAYAAGRTGSTIALFFILAFVGCVRVFAQTPPGLSNAPVITSPGTASGSVNQSFSYQIIATNNPTSYGASGLPPGLSVNPSTGLISGTPTAGGTFAVTVTAANAGGTGNMAVTITIAPATTPDAFSFTSQTGVALNTMVTSNTITVSGINAAAPISITGGSYSVNGAAYTTGSGTVNNGNTVSVRLTSSGSYSTMTCATLTIGGVSGSFCATTLPVAQPTADYTGAWYNANESGWGLSVIHGPLSGLYGIIMYHYNQSTSPTWYWMSGGSFSGNTYTVPVSLYSGPYFGGPFNPALVTSSVVGSATINFTSATAATISYTISGITVTKNIAKLDF